MQRNQSLLLGSFGATLHGAGKPVIEMGVQRNSYVEPSFEFGDIRRTQYDVIVRVRVGLSQ